NGVVISKQCFYCLAESKGNGIKYGQLVEDGSRLVQWQGRVSQTGDYKIDVAAGLSRKIRIG
ncbi:hypothetical protein, partial [Phormidium sp. CCY1219]|uniref:hypothetical protein n=1 Tax=Phormidium sp. CCY1219 TaxID=2886104 RepID=UPI002D1F16BB